MYSDDLTRTPADEDDLWVVLREQYAFARDAFFTVGVETEEEARGLDDSEEARMKRGPLGSLNTIRYRGVSEENDQRDYFLAMGRDLCPWIEVALDRQEMSPEFVQKWGMIMFCHGFVAAHIFDDSDPFVSQRAGTLAGRRRSKDPQRKWLSHILLHFMENGATRQDAEDEAADIIKEILKAGNFSAGYERVWFASMITQGDLAATYDSKHFATKKMEELRAEGVADIPPLPAEIP